MLRSALLLTMLFSRSAGELVGQAVSEPPDTVIAPAESGDVRGAARAAQARYEIRRARHFPRAWPGSSGTCDETVGRFCTWYSEGDWVPEPESPDVATLRATLVDELDTLQAHAAGDGWILGQRVWYRAEGGDWAGALETAESCAPLQEVWWCTALRGFALHGLERWALAERAFDRALYQMDLERAWTWRIPTTAVDGDGRDVMDALRVAPADSVARVLDRFWALADPLHVVEGNDRKTAHFARWTVATMRDGARTPYGIRWGRDLEELLVRHGWELGWEREPDLRMTGPDRIVGHKHPEGRDYLPSGDVLVQPEDARGEDLVAGRRRPRSLYAAPYAPVILPMAGQLAIFPRGERFAVVASYDLPEDTTRRAREGIGRPWMEPGTQAGRSDHAGMFLLDAASGDVVDAVTASGSPSGALLLSRPAGSYLLSVEVWSPSSRLAGRLRTGLVHVGTPEDIPVLSDLLLVRPGGRPPEDLEAAVARALPVPSIAPAERVAAVWEITGLGFREETLTFEMSVVRTDRGVLHRLGRIFGLGAPAEALTVGWDEPGPDEPGPAFRHLELDLPELEPGRYELRVVLRTVGRDPVTSVRVFEVRDPRP
jgi:hypothetical protein